MSDSTFLATDFLPADPNFNPNPMLNYNYLVDYHGQQEFELSDYLALEDGSEEDSTSNHLIGCHSANPVLPEKIIDGSVRYTDDSVRNVAPTPRSSSIKCKGGLKKIKTDAGFRIAFRTKSELEIMDDGFKWRKYGKKTVKNSPNPRNYYRCSSGGCNVKKRVERDREDSSYVITTYEGVHNHESPCVVYYNEMPLMVPSGWTLQASNSSSS
ncbi:PREDICTED: probable WRKY transcription factor 51 isoform X1 [Nelumbo nucifera]|uniref:Probable WRKY transcription factor 51 isoform X1 n=1 Tax=Nelumbo nucifera TaxID=4432 RepID=A0A1U8A7M3_NELNU|nr:PREDICTED: probable WRKY transcription factor 51 isoform X1 [Nelumbo nucifera]